MPDDLAITPSPTPATPLQPAPAAPRHHPTVRLGIVTLAGILALCLGTLPWTLRPDRVSNPASTVPRYNDGSPAAGRLPPVWWNPRPDEARRIHAQVSPSDLERLAGTHALSPAELLDRPPPGARRDLRRASPHYAHPIRNALGTDTLGRSLLYRCLVGGAISLVIGIAAALLSVGIGTVYGALAGFVGGRTDAVLMRIVDILYGLPYVLLVVLLAVASDAAVDEYETRSRERTRWIQEHRAAQHTAPDQPASSIETLALQAVKPRVITESQRTALDLAVLLVAIGGVSWLTMARVIRGQVLSLKNQPFIEAARAVGVGPVRLFTRHLLPNLVGPIAVYATLTVPQAILQESFLSFLGIGVKPPIPSWGNLAADGLSELNPYQSNWWLLLFPCLLLGVTLLAMNFVGEGLRERLDPKSAARKS